ncbi:integrase core domain-containing protein [uncultured Rubinisphaera sp.]|uniref:integrase core domain-containing protein n=3 Tax=Rubinisphaera TaxID=1649490 RepID=UPI0030D8F615|tara:strand:+ start:1971 stop:3035 length:1065 start_codon:yes stop_codon:yes gene_type:complete
MAKIFHPLLALIASATDRELAKYVEYLKAENQILRARIPGQIHTTAGERQKLIKLGKGIGRAIEELITIVTPTTFFRWLRDEKGSKSKTKNPKGGQRKTRELRELVIEIAKTTGFGYTRIIGELRKLGIKNISRQTVRNILKEEEIQPGPDRTTDSWTEFLNRHGETLWASDFFSVKSMTARGLRDLYVMVFLNLQTREAIVTESTYRPNSAWVCRQTKMFTEQTKNRQKRPTILIHDRDTKYTKKFRETVEAAGMKTNPLPKASPNLNGRCERFIETIKLECLNKFIVFGKKHLDYLTDEFTSYYNTKRSHMERDHLPPIREEPDEVTTISIDQIEVRRYVGGLIKSFERKVA